MSRVRLSRAAFVVAFLFACDAGDVFAQDSRAESAPETRPAPEPRVTGGKPYFFFRMWPDFLAKFDPEADTVVAKTKFRKGVGYEVALSHNRRKVYVVTGKQAFIETIDLAAMEVEAAHSFEENGFIVRIDRIMEIPGSESLYVRLEKTERALDRYEPKDPVWIKYTLRNRKKGEEMKELPAAIRRGARISPDGRKWHVFGQDVVVVDPETLKEEGRIKLSEPAFFGAGRMSLRGDDLFDGRNPDAYRMIYSMTDPVKKNRRFMGRVDLDLKSMTVGEVRDWGADAGVWGFAVSGDGKRGVGQKGGGGGSDEGGGGENEEKFVAYDLDSGKRIGESSVKVRTGVRLVALSPDGKKAYLAGRGHEFTVLDERLQVAKIVALDHEIDARDMLVAEL